MSADFDLFISYRHLDRERVAPLVTALRARGLRIWQDDREIHDFQSITQRIRDGLARAKALLAFYSKDYPRSRACQWELTAAFLAASTEHEDPPLRRIFAINPEATAHHVQPITLRDQLQLQPQGS